MSFKHFKHQHLSLRKASGLFLFILIGVVSHWGNAATFTVTSLAGDESNGSIRWACNQANNTPGHDIIVFDVNLGNQPTIFLTDDIFISESVEIQGNSALGSIVQLVGSGGNIIRMNANSVGSNPVQTVFRNLNMRNAGNQGMDIENTENILVIGCLIGTDVTGVTGEGNQIGAFFRNCNNITIGSPTLGNTISNNREEGLIFRDTRNITVVNHIGYGNSKAIDLLRSSQISISNSRLGDSRAEAIHVKLSDEAHVFNNMIGFKLDSLSVATNGGDGVKVEASTNVLVGGSSELERNVIAYSKNGVWVGGGDPESAPRQISNNVNVYGNYIGTDVTGTSPHPNNDHQVRVDDAHNVNIGNVAPGEGNVIGGKAGISGVYIMSEPWWVADGQRNVTIQNNLIGLDASGTNALPNENGITIIDPENRNFEPVRVLNNTISGNLSDGILIGSSEIAHVIQGNTIGLTSNGTPLPNGLNGIILDGASNVILGGTNETEANLISQNSRNGVQLINNSTNNQIIGNTISLNDLNGVHILEATSNNNLISQNSFSCNEVKAINLNGTPEQGIGNNNKNTPLIFSSSSAGNLLGQADPGDLIEIYERGDCQTDGTCSTNDYQMQGKFFVGTTTASANGEWNFNAPLDPEFYTVTSTSASRNTSEFAICGCSIPTFAIIKTDPTTCNGTEGTITLIPAGNKPIQEFSNYQLSYSLNGVVSSLEIVTNASGEYVLDSLSSGLYNNITLQSFTCDTNAGNILLNEPEAPLISTNSTNPTTCSGEDGSITISGLTPNTTNITVNYLLNNTTPVSTTLSSSGLGEIILTSLTEGSYSNIRVTLNECVSNLTSENLTDPETPVISTTSTNPTTCSGNDGSITISGLAPNTNGYTVNYLLNNTTPVSTTLSSSGSGEIILTSLTEGNYSNIRVTLNECVSNLTSENLTDPETPVISTNPTNPTTCSGNDGSITISGLAPNTNGYTVNYLLNNTTPVERVLSSSGSGEIILTSLTEGSYSNIRVTLNECVSNLTSENLTDPETPVISTTSTNPTTCSGNDGSITISGLAPNTNGYTVNYLLNNTTPVSTTLSSSGSGEIILTSLTEGSYSNLRVTLNECVSNLISENLTDPETPAISTSSTNPTICSGNDGTITISGLTPNTSGYTVSYLYNGSSPFTSGFLSSNTGEITLTGLINGNYMDISVTLNGCLSNLEEENLSDPGTPTIAISSNSPSTCLGSNGTITIGGLEPNVVSYNVNYLLNGTVIDTLIPSSGSGEIQLTNLSSGNYTGINVSLAGCTSNSTEVILADPLPPTITTSSTSPTTCLGSDGTLTISGLEPNTANYSLSYSLNGQVTGPLLLGSSNSGEITVSGLSSGNYTNIAVALLGCESNRETEIISEPFETVIPTITLSVDSISCESSEIVVRSEITDGGNNPQFSWYINGELVSNSSDSLVTSTLNSGDLVTATLFSSNLCAIDSVTSMGLPVILLPETSFEISINDYLRCLNEADSLNLTVSTSISTEDVDYEWYVNSVPQGNDANTFSYVPTLGDVLQVGASSNASCLSSDTANSNLTMHFSYSVQANAGEDINAKLLDDVDLSASLSTNAENYTWFKIMDFDSLRLGNSVTETVTPDLGTNTYAVIVANEFCTDTDTVIVMVKKEVIEIPNVFSPNEDNLHDTWIIKNSQLFPEMTVQIFNRWGSVVYSSNGGYHPLNAWDGTHNGNPLPMGTYFYVVDVKEASFGKAVSGHVTILR